MTEFKGDKKTILITGGLGFIGSNFVRYLYDRYPSYEILILDAMTYAADIGNLPNGSLGNGRLRYWYGNVRNAELVGTLVSKSDVVIHFAAETHVTRSIYDNLIFFETDVIGTQVISNAVLKYADKIERFIHISSSEVYGSAVTPQMDEDSHPLIPQNPYAAAKLGADRLVYSYWATYHIPAVILRPFNNYGPFQHLEKVIPRFITSCLMEEPLTIHGDGTSSRDWNFVLDTCDAIDRVIHCDIGKIKGEAINIGSGYSIDIATLANLIIKKMNKPKSFLQYLSDRPGQVVRHVASNRKAKELLGWEPSMPFEEGLDKTIDWYVNNRPWWEKQLAFRHIPIVLQNGEVVSY